MTTRVLFVCMGNICRSPTAEEVLRVHARRAGLVLQTTSICKV
jgi:protein-tyrosine phosphatase